MTTHDRELRPGDRVTRGASGETSTVHLEGRTGTVVRIELVIWGRMAHDPWRVLLHTTVLVELDSEGQRYVTLTGYDLAGWGYRLTEPRWVDLRAAWAAGTTGSLC